MQNREDCIEGTVTSINSNFASFQIEGNIKVHLGIPLARGKIQQLPLVGSKIVIKKGHKFGFTYVVCESSIIKGNFCQDCPWNPFLNLIERYKLGCCDLNKFEEIVTEVEKNFTNLDMNVKQDILLSLFQNLVLLSINNGQVVLGTNICLNRIISKVSLTTVSTCKHVEIKTNKYALFPYWSFGVHPNFKDRMLFGYLEIQPVYGFYMIKNSHYQIVCVIITENCKKTDLQLTQLQNSYVLIEKYTVMTEIFNKNEVPNVEYIIAKLDDINIIHSTKEHNSMFGHEPEKLGYRNIISFVLLKKSTVGIWMNNLPKLLLQVFVRFNSEGLSWKEVYLVLPSKYVSLNLFLKEGALYMMYFSTRLKEVINPLLTAIKDLKIYEVPEGYFQPVNIEMCSIPEPLSITECKTHVENHKDLVSFRGIIKSKRFTDPLPSKNAKSSRLYGFGTPGLKVHQIVFSHADNNRKIFLDCYLNNWENMLMPLGLLPQMEVIVRNVSPQSKKYVKSTIFTSFEIVSYKPLLKFNTINLYQNDNTDWGVPFCLSKGHNIPFDVLVWGRISSIFVLKLTIFSECIRCKQIVNNPIHYDACQETECETKCTAKFNVLDECGQSSVMTKSLEILCILLNLKPTDFKELIATFRHVGTYTYNYFDGSTPGFDILTKYLEKICEKKTILDLKCRKLRDFPSQARQRPTWFCVEARS